MLSSFGLASFHVFYFRCRKCRSCSFGTGSKCNALLFKKEKTERKKHDTETFSLCTARSVRSQSTQKSRKKKRPDTNPHMNLSIPIFLAGITVLTLELLLADTLTLLMWVFVRSVCRFK